VSADYRIANITAPNNTFSVTFYNFGTSPAPLFPQTETITLDEDLYNRQELLEALLEKINEMLVNVNAQSTLEGLLIGGILRLDLILPVSTSSFPLSVVGRVFSITATSPAVQGFLGMSSSTRFGVFTSSLGSFGGMRLTMPREIVLPGLNPYILIQSGALGNDTMTTKGLMFWRALVNDANNPTLQIANFREDTYFSPHPWRLYNIDVRIVYPDGTLLNNRNGVISFLIEVIVDVEDAEKFTDEAPQVQETRVEPHATEDTKGGEAHHEEEEEDHHESNEEENRLKEAHSVAREAEEDQEESDNESGVFLTDKLFGPE
jgi:hypothetical protein